MIRVLVIDDDPDILIVVEGALEAAGHGVVISSDPRRAIALAVEHAADVVILDVNMPELSGFATLSALRKNPRTAGLPVLFLSALGDSEHRIRGLREGADDYLAKPFEPDELVLRVERLASRLQRAGAVEGSDPERVEEALRTGDFGAGEIYFGRYQALMTIGEGAMGVVVRGWDPRLKRPVALKTVRFDHLELTGDPHDAISRLIREATSLARFSHPNIVAIYDAGTVAEIAYLVMELVDGISLRDRLEDGPLTADQAIHLGIAVARALVVAAAHSMVHRDIKPGNILLGYDGSLKVTDFGVAEVVSTLAENEGVFGTPGFVPPECLIGEQHAPAGDVFSLGAVLYRGLTGKPPFSGSNIREILVDSMTREPVPPHTLAPGIPVPLGELILQMLSKDPRARPAAKDLEERLQAMAAGEPDWNLDPNRKIPAKKDRLDSGTLIDTGNLRLPASPREAPRTESSARD